MGGLTGLRIVVTRAAGQAEELVRLLGAAGAQPILLPAIAIAPTSDDVRLRAAARDISQYDWLVLTSANAAGSFLPLVDASASRPKLATVGKVTRARAATFGWAADLTPAQFTAEELADAFDAMPVAGLRFLMPCGDRARDVLPQRLRPRGAVVDVVEAYRTVMPEEGATLARELFAGGVPPDWLTVASPSAVDNLVEAVGPAALTGVKIASIGPATSAAVRGYGLAIQAEAAEHTVAGLVRAMERSL